MRMLCRHDRIGRMLFCTNSLKLDEVRMNNECENLSLHACGSSSSKGLCFRDFQICDREASLLTGITQYTFVHTLQKYCLRPDYVLFDFKHHIAAMSDRDCVDKSAIVYLSIIDMNADILEAMSQVASVL